MVKDVHRKKARVLLRLPELFNISCPALRIQNAMDNAVC